MLKTKYHSSEISDYNFLITGGCGFIGSHLAEYLLQYGAGKVRVLDNFSTGYLKNVKELKENPAFELLEGDIRDASTCTAAVKDIDFVSHQAALGSVPRSIIDPLSTNDVNVSGFLNILNAAKNSQRVKRFVYASSSSVYGDNADEIKTENRTGKILSPYAATKQINELYAKLFGDNYNLQSIGLRYFNVFGPRQSPFGAYAAVIPLFMSAAKNQESPIIYGDGTQSRDFTFVDNVVQANIKAMLIPNVQALNQVFNIGCGESTSINELVKKINSIFHSANQPTYKATRKGDIKSSLAGITKAKELLDFKPFVTLDEGLITTAKWYSGDN